MFGFTIVVAFNCFELLVVFGLFVDLLTIYAWVLIGVCR